MGFSGGGSNVLKPHKHSSAVQDGSPLNMNNVTEATLSAGDVIFSDGAALQRLAIGTPAQQIKVNAGATAPEYFTPSAGGLTNIAAQEDHLTANFSTSSTTAVSTGMELTIQNSAGGIAIIQCSGAVVADATNIDNVHEIFDDGSLPNNAATGMCNNQSAAAERQTVSVNWNMSTDGSVITWMTKVSASGCTIIGTNPPTASLQIAEIY